LSTSHAVATSGAPDRLVPLDVAAARLSDDGGPDYTGECRGNGNEVGGKAIGLARLHHRGFRVPPTWIVPVGARLDVDAFRVLPVDVPLWAVRSSAVGEDGTERSFAGMFRTELGIPTAELPAAVERVTVSAGSARVRRYGGAATGSVAVVLQPYVAPLAAGVWMGRGIDGGRLEWVRGNGEPLVSGAVVPRWEEWDDAGPASAEEVLHCDGQPVGRTCQAVQRVFGAEVDLEFAVLPSGLVWLQCRPVTRKLGAHQGGAGDPATNALRGIAASGGAAAARAVVLHNVDQDGWVPGSVLVVEQTDPDWVPLMTEAAAMVTTTGGALCHAAIIARELNLPCVTAVTSAMSVISTGDLVRVDGDAGTVLSLPPPTGHE
jgi:pyruvate,water dikinase